MSLAGRTSSWRVDGAGRGDDLQRAHEDDLAIREAMQETARQGMPESTSHYSGGARAVVVNRTHRVVREQALGLREQRRRSRSLLVPLLICSILMMVVCYAIWSMLDGYELTAIGVPEASDQLMILLLWLLPVTAAVLGRVWLKRGRGRAGHNGEAQP